MSINWQLLRELRERWLRLEQSQAKDTDIIILREPETPQPEAKGKPSCRRSS
jgi:hypothetical protein